MRRIRLSPASFGLLTSLFCGAATILFGCFWFLSAASQESNVSNQPASQGRPITPAGTLLTDVALDNLIVAPARDARTAYWMKRTQEQNLAKPDQADANTLNRIIWFSVRGDSYPEHRIARMPAFDLMLVGLRREEDDNEMIERMEWRRGAQSRRALTARREITK